MLGFVLAGHLLGMLAFRRLAGPRFSLVVLVVVAFTGVASVVAGLGAA